MVRAPECTTRLYVDAPLQPGAEVTLSGDQAHQLRHVLRLKTGDAVALFNGREGEWCAILNSLGKATACARVESLRRPQTPSPDLWLLFAPVKRARIDFIAEKAAELGVRALQPVITRHTMVARVNVARLRANAIEASEQTARLDVPQVFEPCAFSALLAGWDGQRRILLCDESAAGTQNAPPIATALSALPEAARAAPWAVLTGPEGGFAREELDALRKLPFVSAVSLGPRLLRADTAALAALACWQALCGDWR